MAHRKGEFDRVKARTLQERRVLTLYWEVEGHARGS